MISVSNVEQIGKIAYPDDFTFVASSATLRNFRCNS
jgi:hypothetical protein